MTIVVQVLTLGLNGLIGSVLGIYRFQWAARRQIKSGIPKWPMIVSLLATFGSVIAVSPLPNGRHGPLGLLPLFFLSVFVGTAGEFIIFDHKSNILRLAVVAVILILAFGPNASDLIQHYDSNKLSFISTLPHGQLVVVATAEAMFGAVALFWLRTHFAPIYASIEICAGTLGIIVGCLRMRPQWPDLAEVLGLLSSMYIIVRGLDNFSRLNSSIPASSLLTNKRGVGAVDNTTDQQSTSS